MKWNGYLGFLTSSATWFCCVLPFLLISAGFGASVVSFLEVFPWIITLSENKKIVFLVVFIILIISTFFYFRSRNEPCPIDPELAKSCMKLRKMNLRMLLISWIISTIGVYFAF